jgi:hypothetical protein
MLRATARSHSRARSTVTSGNARKKLLAPGGSPTGWTFDRDYAGGGQIVRFDDRQGHAGWLMSFHGEYH